jgi:hypothetical protein
VAGADDRVDLKRLPLVDHHCHSLRAGWTTAAGEPQAWRRCFTEARRPASLARDVPGLLRYRHFLAAMATRLGLEPGDPERLEARVVARRDQLARADPDGWPRGLLDEAGTAALLVDTGFGGPDALPVAELGRAAARPVLPVARIESIVEHLLRGGAARGSLGQLVERFEARLHAAADGGAVALKSIAAYRTGLALPGHGDDRAELTAAKRKQRDRSTAADTGRWPATESDQVHLALIESNGSSPDLSAGLDVEAGPLARWSNPAGRSSV